MSRTSHPPAQLVVLAVLVTLGLAACSDWSRSQSQAECATTLCCQDCRRLPVSRVIDGDTFDTPGDRVRLYGVDTPESDEDCYQEAANRLSSLAGTSVRVEPGERPADPNGRLLYYVYTGRGESIDEKLVREGLALAWTRDGQHRDLLVRLEEEVRNSRTGCLWE